MALPRDVGLEKDNFQKSRIYTEAQSLLRYIANILLMKPGNLPSMPNVGCDITQYVRNHMTQTLNTEFVRGLIASNCQPLLTYLTEDEVFVGVVQDLNGREYLIISLPLSINTNNENTLGAYYAFYRDELNSLKFNFTLEEN